MSEQGQCPHCGADRGKFDSRCRTCGGALEAGYEIGPDDSLPGRSFAASRHAGYFDRGLWHRLSFSQKKMVVLWSAFLLFCVVFIYYVTLYKTLSFIEAVVACVLFLLVFVFIIKFTKEVVCFLIQVNKLYLFSSVLGICILGAVIYSIYGMLPDRPRQTQSHRSSMSSSTNAKREEVYNSGYSGSVHQVITWLKRNLKDPDSFEAIDWGVVKKIEGEGFTTWCRYRAKNSFGGYNIEKIAFILSSSGDVVSAVKVE